MASAAEAVTDGNSGGGEEEEEITAAERSVRIRLLQPILSSRGSIAGPLPPSGKRRGSRSAQRNTSGAALEEVSGHSTEIRAVDEEPDDLSETEAAIARLRLDDNDDELAVLQSRRQWRGSAAPEMDPSSSSSSEEKEEGEEEKEEEEEERKEAVVSRKRPSRRIATRRTRHMKEASDSEEGEEEEGEEEAEEPPRRRRRR